VVAEDSVNQYIYKVIDGKVQVLTGVSSGILEQVGEYGPGSFFGELSMLSSRVKTGATLVFFFIYSKFRQKDEIWREL
jgi:CRP-like cAMP-binding protein